MQGKVSSIVNERRNRKKYEQVNFRLKLDGSDGIRKSVITTAAKANNMALNQYYIDVIKEKMKGSNGVFFR